MTTMQLFVDKPLECHCVVKTLGVDYVTQEAMKVTIVGLLLKFETSAVVIEKEKLRRHVTGD